jgi:hypothetical protein
MYGGRQKKLAIINVTVIKALFTHLDFAVTEK